MLKFFNFFCGVVAISYISLTITIIVNGRAIAFNESYLDLYILIFFLSSSFSFTVCSISVQFVCLKDMRERERERICCGLNFVCISVWLIDVISATHKDALDSACRVNAHHFPDEMHSTLNNNNTHSPFDGNFSINSRL